MNAAAETVPGTSPGFHVSAGDRTDDRRNKVYARTLSFRTELPHKYGERTLSADSVGRRLCLALDSCKALDYFATEQRVGRVAAHSHPLYSRHQDDWRLACAWTLKLLARKPSEIVSEEEATEWARMHVLPLLREALDAERAEYFEGERRDKAARQANQIGQWAAKKTLEAAKEAVRYDQRLAALKAELDAELSVQARKLVEDGGAFDEAVQKHQADPEQPSFEPEAIAYAREHFTEMHTGWDQPFRDETRFRWFRGNLFPEPEE